MRTRPATDLDLYESPPERQADESPVPAYLHIAQTLAARLNSGEYAAGSRLPSGSELCTEYGVSPMTVRRAIGVLLDRAARVIARRLEIDRSTTERAGEQLPALVATRIGIARAELNRQSASLSALSPYATLERGYSIVLGPQGKVLRDARNVQSGDSVSVRLQHGEIGARVESVRDSTS